LTFAGIFLARTVFGQDTSGPGRGLDTIDHTKAFLIHSNQISRTRIDPVAFVTRDGRRLLLSGPVECTGGERAEVRVTVTQRSTGAVARGRAFITCTGDTQQWEIRATTQGKATFEEGDAIGVAFGLTHHRGQATDAHHWLVNLTLVKQ
jgi:hypothetical protein